MKFILNTLLIFMISESSAQNYGNIWQFGDSIGLDFNNCEPVKISGSNVGFEGCSSISNANGELLFYTNSDKVWDKNNNIMPNGNLQTTTTLSQVLIIPKPQSTTNYYIVTTQIQAAGYLKLRYHEIDMTLNGGLGNVLSANNQITSMIVTEQIAATFHANGSDIWILTHEYGTSNFLAYLVTPSGINMTPVISNIGPAHVTCTSNFNARGEIKFSPNGNKIAFNGNGVATNDTTNILCLLNFDKNSGQVSNPINLPYSRGEFGLSFSPDNKKLYGATWKAFMYTTNEFNYLYQFDITSNDSTTIANSKVIIDSALVPSSYGTLKIAPNGKIYVRKTHSEYIGVINNPNSSGISCDYDKNAIYTGYQNQFGLNNYIEYTNYCNELSINPYEIPPKNKTLLKIIDITGRETEDIPNTLLIYIYDDGTAKKVFRIE